VYQIFDQPETKTSLYPLTTFSKIFYWDMLLSQTMVTLLTYQSS